MEYIGRLEHDRMIEDKSEIVIFGAGKELSCLLNQMNIIGVKSNILCICDNSLVLQGRKIDGIEIVSPEYAFSRYSNAIYIVYNRFCMEISRQLKDKGIKRIHLIRR